MKRFSWILVILWMALIFYLSQKPATESNELSIWITEKIVETVEKVASNVDIDIRSFNHVVRKNAHFFSYLILGILVANGLRSCNINGYRSFLVALLICILYAVSDEIHQLYVPGRSGQVKDVIIDSAGALVGILGLNGIRRRAQ